MQLNELSAYVSAAKIGDTPAFLRLVVAVQRELMVYIATYAGSPQMLEWAFEQTWLQCRGELATAPDGAAFLQWLHQHARVILLRALEEEHADAIKEKDALRHATLRSSLEDLQSGVDKEVAAQVTERLNQLPPSAKNLLSRRYAKNMPRVAIAAEQGLDEEEVAAALVMARGAVDWLPLSAAAADVSDRLFPSLVETYLEGAMIPDEREVLKQDLMRNLELHTLFERQVRLDLVLRALLEPENHDRATRVAHMRAPEPASANARRSTSDRHRVGSDRQHTQTSGVRKIASDKLRISNDRGHNAAIAIGASVGVIGIIMIVLFNSVSAPPSRPTPRWSESEEPQRSNPAPAAAPDSTPRVVERPAKKETAVRQPDDEVASSEPEDAQAMDADPSPVDPDIDAVAVTPEPVPEAAINQAQPSPDAFGVGEVEFYQGSTLLGRASQPPYAITWDVAEAGEYRLTAKTLYHGMVIASRPVLVHVASAADKPADEGLLGRWSLDDGRGMVARDSSGNGNDGAVNGATWIAGQRQGALQFDGANDFVRIPNSDMLNPADLTWAFWVRVRSQGNKQQLLMQKQQADDQNGFSFWLTPLTDAVNPSRIVCTFVKGGVKSSMVSTTTLATNQWYHCAVTVAGTSAKMYMNGVLESFNASMAKGAAADPIFFGAEHGLADASPFNGGLDEVCFYKRALKADEILGLYGVKPAISAAPVASMSIQLSSPGDGDTLTAPATVTLAADVAASTAQIAKVEFYQGTRLLGKSVSPPYEYDWNNVKAGSYSLTAKVTDKTGTAVTSDAVKITVNPASSGPAPSAAPQFPTTINGLAASPYDGIPQAIPGTINISHYDLGGEGFAYHDSDALNREGSAVRPTEGVDCGESAISWTAGGEWINYTVKVESAGTYNLTIQVASANAGGTLRIGFNGEAPVEFAVPNTLDWNAMQLVTQPVRLTAGIQVMRVTFDAICNFKNIVITANQSAPEAQAVSLTSPTAGAVFQAPAAIRLAAAANDKNVRKVEFFEGANLLGSSQSAPYSFTWKNVKAGAYVLSARATVKNGSVTESQAVNVVVNGENVPSPASAINQGLMGHWTFDEPSGTRAADSSGNHLDAVLSNGAAFGPGRIGNALVLDGVDDQVNVLASPLLTMTNACSVAAWIKPKPVAGKYRGRIFEHGGISSSPWLDYNLNLDNYNAPYVACEVQNSVQKISMVQTPSVLWNEWCHAAFTWDGATVTIYLNGKACDSKAAPGTIHTNNSLSTIGYRNAPAQQFFGGMIDDLRVYSRSLDAAEVATLASMKSAAPATVTLTSPADHATFPESSAISLAADVPDAASIKRVEFYQGAKLLGKVTAPPFAFEWENAPAGSYALTAQAIGKDGSATTSDPVNISVSGGAKLEITGPVNGATFVAPTSIVISASFNAH